MSETKFLAWGMVWDVMDWTAFIIILCIVFVLVLGIIVGCCMCGGDKALEETLALEKAEIERNAANQRFKENGKDRLE